MAGQSAPTDAAGRSAFGRELKLRVASALVMAPLAIAAAYWGGWPFALFWMAAGLCVLWEWGRFVSAIFALRLAGIGAAALASGALAVVFDRLSDIPIVLAVAMAAAGVVGRGWWGPAGLLYAGGLVLSPIMLRADPTFGLAAVILLFAVVWGTDIAAYFGGRLIGGPKLWPRISPKKTWSGGITGAVVAMAGGVAVAGFAGVTHLAPVALLCLVLSTVSQGGDFLESGIKRHFDAKDAGHLIPGHGGLMDRLDGFVTATVVAAVIGLVRGGLEAPSRGLLIW